MKSLVRVLTVLIMMSFIMFVSTVITSLFIENEMVDTVAFWSLTLMVVSLLAWKIVEIAAGGTRELGQD